MAGGCESSYLWQGPPAGTCVKIRSIELLRGLAALSVAVAHADSLFGGNKDLPFGRWHSFAMPGTAGVEFFFVLSGFVMALAHGHEIAHGGHVGRFLWKRFCRIYPLYWVVLAVPLYRFWGAPMLTPQAIGGWLSLLPVRIDNLLVVAWTLRQEVTFYLVLALCLLPAVGRWILAAWVLFTTALWFVLPPVPGVPGTSIPLAHVFSIFDFEFFAGLLAGWLLPRLPRGAGPGWALLAAGCGGLAWRMSLDDWGADYGPVHARPVYGGAYAAIILGCAALERAGAWRFGRVGGAVAGWAGALSYPLYLSHLLTLDAIAGRIGPSGVAARIGADATFAVLLAGAVLGGAVLAYAVDRPMQRALRWVSGGSMRPRPAPG